MRQPTIHQMREKKKSSRKSQGSRKVTILYFFYDQINKWNTQTKQATFLLNVNLNIQTK
jgi:hypothetical protein